MKIKKLYDDEISQPQLEDFAADILEYFDPNDKILTNMGSYDCGIVNTTKINLIFKFITISEPELNCLFAIFSYCKSFSKISFFYLTSQQINKIIMIHFTISFLQKDYSKIKADLDIMLKGKKYNIL